MSLAPPPNPAESSDAPCPDLQLSAYDYPLPDALIARYPLPERDQSRMMVLDRGQPSGVEHSRFDTLPARLAPGDLLVVNNTRVLPARLRARRQPPGRPLMDGQVEILMLQPVDLADDGEWWALVKPMRKCPPGTRLLLPGTDAYLEVIERAPEDRLRLRAHLAGFARVSDLLDAVGEMPIPPYLNRSAEPNDQTAYQTVYANGQAPLPGSQAAPTAGLHFTPRVLDALSARGVRVMPVTLSVSSGTFRLVRDEDVRAHVMDAEQFHVPDETARAIAETRARSGRVVAVGTTVVRTLETTADVFNGEVRPHTGWSQIFIYPGFQFQAVDALLTNFHLPKSTLMMLVSALAGRERVMAAYHEAVAEQYRFFSYGDCMLIL